MTEMSSLPLLSSWVMAFCNISQSSWAPNYNNPPQDVTVKVAGAHVRSSGAVNRVEAVGRLKESHGDVVDTSLNEQTLHGTSSGRGDPNWNLNNRFFFLTFWPPNSFELFYRELWIETLAHFFFIHGTTTIILIAHMLYDLKCYICLVFGLVLEIWVPKIPSKIGSLE